MQRVVIDYGAGILVLDENNNVDLFTYDEYVNIFGVQSLPYSDD